MLRALTRPVPESFSHCLLTHLSRRPIDIDLARRQHVTYEAELRKLGVDVIALPPEDELPDSVFVEDAAVVADEIAIIAFMGAKERRPEAESLSVALTRYRPVRRMNGPGCLDGGDVIQIGKNFYIGKTNRTSAVGIEEFGALVTPLGYKVTTVPVQNCLHLKSACTFVGRNTVLVNPAWVDPATFHRHDTVEVDVQEPWAANALPIGSAVLVASASPKTRQLLEDRGFATVAIDISEFMKAEGALTCKSIVFNA